MKNNYVYKDPFQLRVSKISDVLDIIYWEVGVTKHLLGCRCALHALICNVLAMFPSIESGMDGMAMDSHS